MINISSINLLIYRHSAWHTVMLFSQVYCIGKICCYQPWWSGQKWGKCQGREFLFVRRVKAVELIKPPIQHITKQLGWTLATERSTLCQPSVLADGSNVMRNKVITTMVIWPLDDHTYLAQYLVANLRTWSGCVYGITRQWWISWMCSKGPFDSLLMCSY